MQVLGRHARSLFSFAIAAVLIGGAAAPACAASPRDDLERGVKRILNVLAEESISEEERERGLREAFYDLLDFSIISQKVLMQHIHKGTPRQQEEFMRLFARLAEKRFLWQIREGTGANVEYFQTHIDGDHATVRSNATVRGGQVYVLKYRMIKRDRKWKIYDIDVAGVGYLQGYRAEINKLFRVDFKDLPPNEAFERLLNRLREKVKEKR